MMDNYEQAILPSERLKNIDDIHQIEFTEKSKFDHVEKFDVKTQNFSFGANILNTTTMSLNSSHNCSSEEMIKTTTVAVNKIQTITMPDSTATTTSTVTEEFQLSTVSMSIADTPPVSVDEKTDCSSSEEQDNSEDNENSQLSQSMAASKDFGDDDEDLGEDDSDDSSSDSDYSDLSGLSDMSGREWKPISQRPLNWVQKQIHSGVNPREILSKFLPTSIQRISPELTDMTLWRILASMMEPPRRKKLSYINTFEDVIELLKKSKNIIVLTGAGVSVSCGIPDFRSSDGIYSRLAKDYPNLPDPQAMFDINFFSRDPRPFYKFAREIYPGQFKPSPCHRFIKMLEQKQKLLRNYTQNIDTLEQVAGIKNVIECHGSFSTASCTKCKYKCDADTIRDDIFAQRIPVCPRCQPNVEQSVDASQPVSELELRMLVENGIMKPDIVFFGEGLPDEFHTVMGSDKDKCDLLIVMGSSLKVRPVALIPSSIPNNVPQILINREQLHHLEFDVELLGDGDVIINQICHRLGEDWKNICFDEEILQESSELIAYADDEQDNEEEEEEGEEEEEKEKGNQAALDNDCLSVKSSQSNDLNLQSATTYSDSGFETSSTSSKKDGEFLPPDYLDEPMESSSFGYRHLSIDSSKDSGILGDGSNSALPPSFNSFSEAGEMKKSLNMPATSTQAISNKATVKKTAEKQNLRRQQRHQTAAERLYSGTYYAHDASASYVFPGACVSWSSDSEDEEDELNPEDNEKHAEDAEDAECETNHVPLSPLMTPSVENEMVKDISNNSQASASTNNFSNVIKTNAAKTAPTTSQASSPSQLQKKRPSVDAVDNVQTHETVGVVIDTTSSPPPHKKRRDSADTSASSNTSSSLCITSFDQSLGSS
ncbi:NAD-dependent histone deacetylase sirtuin-1 [Stomoxys calcitrans]|uniref:protein acetyllysine N-acetyltransferase n=1 Tax=Stomoxys calcitrans TaxID=35570 RepID=A0A1I8PR41_STOCA|nr:NAD-dependent histone deacetylase sirtuin-1 [Stomoxys calcitrans]